MLELLTTSFTEGLASGPLPILVRLLCAVLLGAAVAWVYLRTSPSQELGSTFPVTLVLLSVLIAMVTQVVGDNVARAFSLVGALSIVRFRTVVRDTRDTAFVIFAVAVGMAVGARNFWVALIGFVVVSAAVAVAARFGHRGGHQRMTLTVRTIIAEEPGQRVAAALEGWVDSKSVVCVETAKQRTCLEVVYEVRLRDNVRSEELVRALNQVEGVTDVKLQRRGFEV